MMKHLTRSRGAAAALLLTTIAPALAAQGVQPARARPRDSVFVRMFALPGVPMESLKVLVRALEREPYGSADWLAITRRVDSLLSARKAGIERGIIERGFDRRTAPAFAPTGWLGFLTQGPSQQIFDQSGLHVIYFAYPQIISVDPNSPAERAGITQGDVLVAYNGLDVVNREFNLTELLQPDRKVMITVRRDGDTKDFSVRVARGPERIAARRRELDAALPGELRMLPADPPEAIAQMTVPAMPMPPGAAMSRLLVFSPNGMFGASLAAVTPGLAKVLRLKTGVLATDVPEESPAWRAGLRTGDVIISVDREPVFTVNEFRDRVMTHMPQHAVALQVVRDQKPRTIRLSWPSP